MVENLSYESGQASAIFFHKNFEAMNKVPLQPLQVKGLLDTLHASYSKNACDHTPPCEICPNYAL